MILSPCPYDPINVHLVAVSTLVLQRPSKCVPSAPGTTLVMRSVQGHSKRPLYAIGPVPAGGEQCAAQHCRVNVLCVSMLVWLVPKARGGGGGAVHTGKRHAQARIKGGVRGAGVQKVRTGCHRVVGHGAGPAKGWTWQKTPKNAYEHIIMILLHVHRSSRHLKGGEGAWREQECARESVGCLPEAVKILVVPIPCVDLHGFHDELRRGLHQLPEPRRVA